MNSAEVISKIAKALKTKPITIPQDVVVVPSIADYADPFYFGVQSTKPIFEPTFEIYYKDGKTHVEIVWDVEVWKTIALLDGVVPVYYSYGGKGGITFVKRPEGVDLEEPPANCTGLEDLINVIGQVMYNNLYCIDLGEDPDKRGYMVVLRPSHFVVKLPDIPVDIYTRRTPDVVVSNSGIEATETVVSRMLFGRSEKTRKLVEKKMFGLVYLVLGRTLVFGYNVEPMLIGNKTKK